MKRKVSYTHAMTLLAGAIAISFSPAYAATTTAVTNANVDASNSSAQKNTEAQENQNSTKDTGKQKNTKKKNKLSTTNMGAILVTSSIRESLGSALAIQRNSDNLVDSIVAEGIGKLPDTSVADSLQRVTGVQVSRSNGETNGVVIRGLPNVITTLNGREIFSGSGRGFAFQDLPSQAVKALNVYKTSSSDLVAGGIAGLVNIRLFRPFDFKGLEIAGTLQGNHPENGSKIKNGQKLDPQGSFLISDRWKGDYGEFGALINVSYRAQHFDYPVIFNDVAWDATSYPNYNNGQEVMTPNTVGAVENAGYRRRPEGNYALQWRPNDQLEIYAEGVSDGYNEIHEANFYFSSIPIATSVSDMKLFPSSTPHGCFPYNGTQLCGLQSGTFHNGYAATSTQALKLRGHDTQNAIGVKWHNGGWQLKSDLAYTNTSLRSRRMIIDQYINSSPDHAPYTSDVTTVVNTNAGGHPNWYLKGNPQLDPDQFYLNGLFQTFYRENGSQLAWSNTGEYDFTSGFITRLQFGVRYSDHKAKYTGSTQISTPPPNPNIPATEIGPDYLTNVTPDTFSSVLPQWLSGDTYYMLNNSAALREFYGLPPGPPDVDPGRGFRADEKTYSGYLQVGYEFNIGDVPVDGLIGARLVHKNRTLTSVISKNGVYTPTSARTSGNDVLPNISARVGLTQYLQLRLSAAKTISYPAFSSLNPAESLAPPTINRLGYGSSGNPNLKPIKSTNYDAEIAWYFAPQSAVSLAGFYRKINGYIQTYSVSQTINGELYSISRPESAGSGYLKGLEAAYQQFFTFLPGALSGFGIQLNYTYIDGRTKSPESIGGEIQTTPLGNVSRNNYNAILIYQKYGFSGRLAYNYRNEYIANFNVAGIQVPKTSIVKPANLLDLSLSYDINKHFTLTFDAINLNHAKFHSYSGAELRPGDYRSLDTTYSLGVRFRL